MKRRHLKGVMAIERQVYPRPWSPSLFLSEMSETENRAYLEIELWTRPEDEGRLVVLTGRGKAWAERWERLEGVTSSWRLAS